MLVLSRFFYPSLPQKETVVWLPHVEAKSLCLSFCPAQPGAAQGPACSQLSDLPQWVSHLPDGRRAGLLCRNPSALEPGVPERKAPEQPRMRTQRLRLCSYLSRGSVPPSQTNELINDNPVVKYVDLNRWKPRLFFFQDRGLWELQWLKRRIAYHFKSGVRYWNHTTEHEPFS